MELRYKKPEKCNNLNELFDSWLECQKESNLERRCSFTKDGYLGSKEEFDKQKVKVLYILKEANSRCENGELRIEEGGFWTKEVVV